MHLIKQYYVHVVHVCHTRKPLSTHVAVVPNDFTLFTKALSSSVWHVPVSQNHILFLLFHKSTNVWRSHTREHARTYTFYLCAGGECIMWSLLPYCYIYFYEVRLYFYKASSRPITVIIVYSLNISLYFISLNVLVLSVNVLLLTVWYKHWYLSLLKVDHVVDSVFHKCKSYLVLLKFHFKLIGCNLCECKDIFPWKSLPYCYFISLKTGFDNTIITYEYKHTYTLTHKIAYRLLIKLTL